ncbi:MAG: RNA methyltransferase [Candidatus Cloacimonadaceae bacterium]|jgi:TrmH family RNA methyltransferase|nr:RNA methyltransferase [Candidatus Cloacimonadota bacterium]MDY0127523.1 RNA methyltransferase [Candidatus Cloacimonadaceae bacterium]MCB5254893.1 RNA methyltransferase [Candidatus Cloacimonadota bacterium]MCK9177753.1 RNA methyltransferase [Candidatus Cloacimonadota bacterium]MCK9242278.1 RNA methyltransferase [Candidatus Cloacimonadota bacterium]
MSPNSRISKQRISDLAKLKQKKYRQEQKLVIVEGQRLIDQLLIYGIRPEELYFVKRPQIDLGGISSFELTQYQMQRICESEHPADLAGLFRLPQARKQKHKRALYLDRISDPGNLGTIFRTAAAFGIAGILLSEVCCEIASPKVIRASLGAVYKVPFHYVSPLDLPAEKARLLALDMNGAISLSKHQPSQEDEIYILGSEAHGIDPELLKIAHATLRIEMKEGMESLNVAMSAAILCYHLSYG